MFTWKDLDLSFPEDEEKANTCLMKDIIDIQSINTKNELVDIFTKLLFEDKFVHIKGNLGLKLIKECRIIPY
ncbi:hypothetical protein CR513_33221, partial [Mucuna pruriens]